MVQRTTTPPASPLPALEATLTGSQSPTKPNDRICITGAGNLDIQFQRTIRVPDNKGESDLPPDMGEFPLYSVADFESTLPKHMIMKGGIFLPMYRRWSSHYSSRCSTDGER